jgi:cardiolipin synthase
MNLSFLPNLLCILRILLVYPVALWILQGRYAEVIGLVALAAFTDLLDGFLAKQFDWTSALGRFLDPLADKLLLVTVFVCLSIVGHAPWWLTGLVLLRDLVIASGAAAYRLLFGPINGRPTIPSKLNTFCQILFCLSVLANMAYNVPPAWWLTGLGALVFVSTFVSGLDYVLTYSRRAAAASRARRAAAGR